MQGFEGQGSQILRKPPSWNPPQGGFAIPKFGLRWLCNASVLLLHSLGHPSCHSCICAWLSGASNRNTRSYLSDNCSIPRMAAFTLSRGKKTPRSQSKKGYVVYHYAGKTTLTLESLLFRFPCFFRFPISLFLCFSFLFQGF